MPGTPSRRAEMQVVACGVIGREDAVVLVHGPEGWSLPGARVEASESVEDALARGVRAAIGAQVSQSDFLCLTENPGLLVVVFDLILDSAPEELPAPARWWAVDQLETAPLHPAALRSVLRVGDPPAWLPHRPSGTEE